MKDLIRYHLSNDLEWYDKDVIIIVTVDIVISMSFAEILIDRDDYGLWIKSTNEVSNPKYWFQKSWPWCKEG